MLSVANHGALVAGVPVSSEEPMAKAKITRGVLVRGVAYPPDAIVEVTNQELNELRSWNYAVTAPADAEITPPGVDPAKVPPKTAAPDPAKGTGK